MILGIRLCFPFFTPNQMKECSNALHWSQPTDQHERNENAQRCFVATVLLASRKLLSGPRSQLPPLTIPLQLVGLMLPGGPTTSCLCTCPGAGGDTQPMGVLQQVSFSRNHSPPHRPSLECIPLISFRGLQWNLEEIIADYRRKESILKKSQCELSCKIWWIESPPLMLIRVPLSSSPLPHKEPF